jgi:hypothetical protein
MGAFQTEGCTVNDDQSQGQGRPQFIPGGGWMVTWKHGDGSTDVEPVVAWSTSGGPGGEGRAMVTDHNGYLAGVEGRDRNEGICIWHPDQMHIEADSTTHRGWDAYEQARPTALNPRRSG